MHILTINTGSSSVRLAVFESKNRRIVAHQSAHYPVLNGDEVEALRGMLPGASDDPPIIAHRIVHGGQHLTEVCLIDAAVEEEIERLVPLAPLHNPAALRWLRAARVAFGEDVEQVAVFDTAYYTALPKIASTYALPQEFCQSKGLCRYGFHGLAHRAMWQRWQSRVSAGANSRVISFQLGSGCSVTATRDGFAQDTSMGFSPLEGLVMATRAGDIDPGLILYLQTEIGFSPNDIDTLLNRESGLLGLSGLSSDMRELLNSTAPAAQFAIDVYCYRARKYLGAYLAVLGGVDAILFGGGVGENSPEIRRRILAGMEFAGIVLSGQANARAVGIEDRISTDDSRVGVYVIPVDEGVVLAKEAIQVISRREAVGPRSSAGT